MQQANGSPKRKPSAFSIYLRTGRRVASRAVEVKFNPWHDPANGRFTFAGQGRHYPNGYTPQRHAGNDGAAGTRGDHQDHGGRKPSRRDPYVPDRSDLDPRHPRNWTSYVVQRGDTLSGIAQKRKGLTAEDLAWLNNIPLNRPLQISQKIRLPTQHSLEAGREARAKFLALALYKETHGGKLPPDVANPPSVAEQISATYRHVLANGYNYELDLVDRYKRVTGVLTRNKDQGRSRVAQKIAGGPDRLPKDHGGHVIARRFNGPKDWFNHFAQDGSFNQGAYAKLEKDWDKAMDAGHAVRIDIRASYEGVSRRPSLITAYYWIDGKRYVRRFPNAPQGKSDE